MKIGIDVRTACQPFFGKGVYTWNIVREILALDRKNTYFLYANAITGNLASFAVHPSVHLKIINGHPLLWHFKVMKHFKAVGGEMFFAPTSFIVPAFLTKKISSVITVHDLVAFRYPNLHETKATILENLFFRKALRKTHHVIVPSENTKQDLIKLFRYPHEKISVIPHGISGRFLKPPENLKTVKEKYNLPERFVLTVSGLEPRKNVEKLINAIASVALRQAQRDIKLVIVGSRGWKSQKTQEKISKAREKIIWIENCSPDELPAFYRLATVFIYPSLYEGFGFPPLEAMASGCPVICSNASSLPEVCGDAALMIDPQNINGLAEALEKLLSSTALQKELSQKGRGRAYRFSWRAAAEKTLEILQKSL